MAELNRLAEIQYSTGKEPVVQVVVPHGTRLTDLASLLEIVSKEINPLISPRGCEVCTSGNHLFIKERLEKVIQVDLDSGQILGR